MTPAGLLSDSTQRFHGPDFPIKVYLILLSDQSVASLLSFFSIHCDFILLEKLLDLGPTPTPQSTKNSIQAHIYFPLFRTIQRLKRKSGSWRIPGKSKNKGMELRRQFLRGWEQGRCDRTPHYTPTPQWMLPDLILQLASDQIHIINSCKSYTIVGEACKDGHNGEHPEIGRNPDGHYSHFRNY